MQVVEDSSVDNIRGTCGDQKYLDEWPNLYKTLKIMKSHGMGVAPWNLNRTNIRIQDNEYFADDDRLIFFHFHGLEIYHFKNRFKLWANAPGYNLKDDSHVPLYSEYLSNLDYYANTYSVFFAVRRKKLSLLMLLIFQLMWLANTHLFWNRRVMFINFFVWNIQKSSVKTFYG